MKTHLILLVIISLFGFIIGPNYADGDEINACVNDRNGLIRVVDNIADCRSTESPLSWNIEGPPGEQGPPGSSGFDANKLYSVTCLETNSCQCEDRGGRIFISANVICDKHDTAAEDSLYTSLYVEETETFDAFCTCAQIDPPITCLAYPKSIQLICYDNS